MLLPDEEPDDELGGTKPLELEVLELELELELSLLLAAALCSE